MREAQVWPDWPAPSAVSRAGVEVLVLEAGVLSCLYIGTRKPTCQRLSGLWPTETLTTQNHSALGEQGIELLVALVDPDSPSRSR